MVVRCSRCTKLLYITLEFITIRCQSGIHRSSVHRVVKKELQLKCLKKINAQKLTAANKQARMTRDSFWTNIRTTRWTSCSLLRKKSYSPLLPRPTHRTIVFYVRPDTREKNVNERDQHSASQLMKLETEISGASICSILWIIATIPCMFPVLFGRQSGIPLRLWLIDWLIYLFIYLLSSSR